MTYAGSEVGTTPCEVELYRGSPPCFVLRLAGFHDLRVDAGRVDPPLAAALVDILIIPFAFVDLASGALDYIPRGGPISVRLTPSSEPEPATWRRIDHEDYGAAARR